MTAFLPFTTLTTLKHDLARRHAHTSSPTHSDLARNHFHYIQIVLRSFQRCALGNTFCSLSPTTSPPTMTSPLDIALAHRLLLAHLQAATSFATTFQNLPLFTPHPPPPDILSTPPISHRRSHHHLRPQSHVAAAVHHPLLANHTCDASQNFHFHPLIHRPPHTNTHQPDTHQQNNLRHQHRHMEQAHGNFLHMHHNQLIPCTALLAHHRHLHHHHYHFTHHQHQSPPRHIQTMEAGNTVMMRN